MHWSTLAAGVLFAATLSAAETGALSVVNVVLHQYEDGPGIPPAFTYVAGETVFLSFQVAGFKAEGEDQVVQLSYQLGAADGDGVALLPTKSGKLRAELAPQDKDWKPKVRWEFVLPPWAPSGDYKITASIRDLTSGQEASREVALRVRGTTYAAGPPLAVRDFRFLRTAEDGEALNPAAYKAGDTVWARFDITGFKLAEKNRLQVDYDVIVLAPNGDRVYTQPSAAGGDEESFYPKRFTMGSLSLTTTPAVKPGEYTVLVLVRDKIGSQNAEARHKFRIE